MSAQQPNIEHYIFTDFCRKKHKADIGMEIETYLRQLYLG